MVIFSRWFLDGFIFKIIKLISLFLQLKMGGQKTAAPSGPLSPL